MRSIDITNPHRQKHFDFFRQMSMPHFSMVVPVPVQILTEYIHDHQLHFTSTILYLISKTANAIPEFRQRVRGDLLIEHDVIHPSSTVPTDAADVFSICYVEYSEDFRRFADAVKIAQESMRSTPSFEMETDGDDYLYTSPIPWVHFTGFTHAMHVPVRDSIPRFVWGKIKHTSQEDLMPLGVQVHHAVVDGRHVGMYYELFSEYCAHPERSIVLHPLK